MLRKPTNASRLLGMALVALTLVGAQAAYGDEPTAQQSTDSTPAEHSLQGEGLADVAWKVTVTLAVEMAFCVGLGFCAGGF